MQVTQNGYLSPKEIASAFNISVKTFQRMTVSIRKKIRKKKNVKHIRLYAPSEVEEIKKVLA